MALYHSKSIGISTGQDLADRSWLSNNLNVADESAFDPSNIIIPSPTSASREYVLTDPLDHRYVSVSVNTPSEFYTGVLYTIPTTIFNNQVYPAGVITDTVALFVNVQSMSKYKRTVESITITSGQGASLENILVGDVFLPYAQKVLIVRLEKEGVSSISAVISIKFEEDPSTYSFTISGFRFYLPFMLEGNWRDGMEITRSFLTSIFSSYGSAETRKMLRKTPMRTMKAEISFLSDKASTQAWQAIRARARGPNVVPFYPDIQRMTQANDLQRIYIPTAQYRFTPNGLIIAVKYKKDGSLEYFDVHRIVQVFADSVTTQSGIVHNYDVGDVVYPGLVCYPSFGSDTKNNVTLSRGTIDITAEEIYDLTAMPIENESYTPTESYGLPVFYFKPNERDNIDYEVNYQGEMTDSGRGKSWYLQGGYSFLKFTVLISCFTRAEYWDFIGFVNYVRGRGRTFWIPNYDVFIFPFNESTGFIDVEDLDISDWNQIRYLWLEDASGVIEVVEVSGVAAITGGFRISFNPPAITPVLYKQALRARLDSDEITEKWYTDSVVEVTLPIRELQGEPQGD